METIVQAILKAVDASARFGVILALFAGFVRLLRWLDLIKPADFPPTALNVVDLLGILGCSVVIVSLGAVAWREGVYAARRWRLRRSQRAQSIFHLHRIGGDQLNALLYQFRRGDRMILGHRNHYILEELHELFLIEEADNGALLHSDRRSYRIPAHIWRELEALNEKHKDRELPKMPPWEKFVSWMSRV